MLRGAKFVANDRFMGGLNNWGVFCNVEEAVGQPDGMHVCH